MRVGDSSVRDGRILTDIPGSSRAQRRGPAGGPAPLSSLGAGSRDETPRSGAGYGAEPHVEESPFARILKGLGREVDRGETLVGKAARGGSDLGSSELIALQVGVYRYSEAVDLSAKLVDRATSGVKTVLQGQ